MASAIHAIHLTAPDVAKPAVICDVCRKHADYMPTHDGSHPEACAASPDPSLEKHPSPLKVHEDAGHFDCSICLDVCNKPVVTHCGHLFCWPCLSYWLSLHSVVKECPVCKANVQDRVIPLYGCGRADHSMNSAAGMKFGDIEIPCLPQPRRSDVAVFTTAVTNHDAEHNDVIQGSEIHSMNARHAAASANDGFLWSMQRRGGMAPLTNYRGLAHNGMSIVAPLQRSRKEKEIVLHWAFIFAASIAIVGFIVC